MTCEIASIGLFVMGWMGVLLRQRNVLQLLMCMELILLAVILNFVAMAWRWQSIHGHVISLFILAAAAVETVIVLAVLVMYRQQKGTICVDDLHELREEM